MKHETRLRHTVKPTITNNNNNILKFKMNDIEQFYSNLHISDIEREWEERQRDRTLFTFHLVFFFILYYIYTCKQFINKQTKNNYTQSVTFTKHEHEKRTDIYTHFHVTNEEYKKENRTRNVSFET